MKTYAKILSRTSVSKNPPKSATINGKIYIGPLPEDYLATIGFYPYEEDALPEDIPSGHHAEPFYEHKNGKTVRAWEIVEDDPPVVLPHLYSKIKILLAAQESGFSDALIEFIESDKTIEFIWNASNVIENNEIFAAYLPSTASALGKTEQEVIDFLEQNCVAD